MKCDIKGCDNYPARKIKVFSHDYQICDDHIEPMHKCVRIYDNKVNALMEELWWRIRNGDFDVEIL